MSSSTIVLCGGPINYTNLPIGTNQSNAMVPINGKPVISWILDDLIGKGNASSITVVLREQDQRLKNFLRRVYADNVTICALHHEGTIVQSLEAGLHHSDTNEVVRIVLGDTLIRDPYDFQDDTVYVGDVEDSRRWCLVFTNAKNEIIGYLDKQEVDTTSRRALAGYYHLIHGDYLKKCVQQSIQNGETQLSAVLRRYGVQYPIKTTLVKEWYDFGNIDNLVKARRELLRPRTFNSLVVDPILNTITKVSQHDKKLRDELAWYLQLPEELKVLTPRIVNYHEVNGQLKIVQEYYGYPTLGELLLYSELHIDMWHSILKLLFRIHDVLRRYPGDMEPEHVATVYKDKTWERLAELKTQSSYWRALIQREAIIFNGQVLRNINELREPLCAMINELVANSSMCIIHGDLCFSNILFDINNQIVRLIDPRGSFGRPGIYGDPRYDVAKLRHSICNFYDYIVADMFAITEDGSTGEFRGEIYDSAANRIIGTIFDELAAQAGYNLKEVRLIEGLLFVSMVPLHRDSIKRQLMMYLTGIKLLNDVLQ